MRVSNSFAVVAVAAGLMLCASARAAVLDFEFNSLSAGAKGTSVSLTVGGDTITATGYVAPSPSSTTTDLYVKNNSGDEKGLGINGALDDELTLNDGGHTIANFIQVDVTSIEGLANGLIKSGSDTNGEKFDVWGSNTLGTLGTKLISGSTTDQTFVSIPSWGTYKYISMSVTPNTSNDQNNVLLAGFEVTTVGSPVPLPASVWSGIVGLGMVGGLGLLRRRGAATLMA